MINKAIHDGLILRSISTGVATDRERLPQFYMDAFAEHEDGDEPVLAEWTRNLLNGRSTTTDDDIWVIVDPAENDKIVSALLLIPQTWHYADMPFDVGRVELVATDPAYRNRGLVRILMQTLHQRSAALGHPVQAITGIGHYYRQFGYGMSMDLGVRGLIPLCHIPTLEDDQKQTHTLRLAEENDIPALVALNQTYTQYEGVSLVRDAARWRYEISDDFHPDALRFHVFMVEIDDEPVGYVAVHFDHFMGRIMVYAFVLGQKTSYLAAFDDVLRGIQQAADAYFADYDKKPKSIELSTQIPAVVDQLIRYTHGGSFRDPFAWYIRVPDLSAFLNRIRPVLERRLARSGANNYSGTLSVMFFNQYGVVMTFEDGKMIQVEHKAVSPYKHDAGFPYYTFLDLVFGRHDVDTLRATLPEIFVNKKAAVLLDALFPRTRPLVWGLS
jgi:GNAT superfamily N-acetyltransferase